MNRSFSVLIFPLIVTLGLGVRLIFLPFPGNFDQESYRLVVAIIERGGNVYMETSRYNYSPIWAYTLYGLHTIAIGSGISLSSAVRIFLSVIDCGNALLLGNIFQRRNITYAYLFNPVALLLVGYHGQFETFAVFPLLVGVLLIMRKPTAVWSFWVLATITLIIKHIFLFHIWAAFVIVSGNRFRASVMMGMSILCWLFSFAPYLPAGSDGIIHNVLLYRGTSGVYGIGAVLPPLVGFAVLLACMGLLPFWLRADLLLLPEHLCFVGVIFLATLPGIGIHYLLIPLLFGIVSPGYIWYSAWCTLLLLTSPNNIHVLAIAPLWNYAWIGTLGWAAYMIISPKLRGKQPATP